MVRYDNSFRQLIANCINSGGTMAEIVDRLQVSDWTVQRYCKNIVLFSIHNPSDVSHRDRLKSIHLEARHALYELLNGNGTMMLDEIQDWLKEEFDIVCSLATISRCLKDMNLTNKRIEKTSEQQDSELCA